MKNFFKGISFSSISAGALAAVTSFLLSAKIGIAGSVIGVAAGSIVSAVSTQIYKNVLKASGEKIQNAVPFGSNSDGETPESDAKTDNGTEATQVIGEVRHGGSDTAVITSDQTAVMSDSPRVIASGKDGTEATSILANPERNTKTKRSVKAGSSSAGGSRTMHHTGETRVMAWLHGKYAPAIIAFVGALVGVGLSAGLILFFTHGKGTDTVVHDVVYEKVTPSTSSSDTGSTVSGTPTSGSGTTTSGTDTTDGATDQPTTSGSDKTSGSTSDSTSGTSGSSDSSTGTTDGGSSSTDGSDSSSTDSGTDSGTSSGSNSSGSTTNDSTSGTSTGESSDSGTSTNSSGTTGTTN
ncbi:hypothetical protein [Bifidobacterium dentium]|uniref:hypothetical protein n=1 Tax=Bifidobacterium dentium TaxID=1689 RepID=UPI0001716656|nr:hypothetical protein BIFDEN_01971 [Bifidobacterium dentium ATCC 27678]BAQ27167.1 conserved hypothetical protein [Bifidobacterium dentium JCM 1195 = DSM 20436]